MLEMYHLWMISGLSQLLRAPQSTKILYYYLTDFIPEYVVFHSYIHVVSVIGSSNIRQLLMMNRRFLKLSSFRPEV